MSCAWLNQQPTYDDIALADAAAFFGGNGSINTAEFADGDDTWDVRGDVIFAQACYYETFPTYGFSKTKWGNVMSSYGDSDAYLYYNWLIAN